MQLDLSITLVALCNRKKIDPCKEKLSLYNGTIAHISTNCHVLFAVLIASLSIQRCRISQYKQRCSESIYLQSPILRYLPETSSQKAHAAPSPTPTPRYKRIHLDMQVLHCNQSILYIDGNFAQKVIE